MIRLAFILSCLISSFAFAYEPTPEAARSVNESWEEALNRQLPRNFVVDPQSARAQARPYRNGLDVRAIPLWPSNFEDLRETMAAIRDERVYEHTEMPGFMRRSTWLYPVDGCYARAEHVSLGFELRDLPRPGKVLAFGRLRFRPTYGPRSTVYWSYHIAPAYRLGGEVFVLDPAAHPTEPLHFDEWLDAMTDSKEALLISGCGENTYSPVSRCSGGERIPYDLFERHQMRYMEPEWNRLVKERFDPTRVLGDEPPWTTHLRSEAGADGLPPFGFLRAYSGHPSPREGCLERTPRERAEVDRE